MKKITYFIASLLLILGASLAYAEEVSVKVSSDRSAVVTVSDKSANPDVSGTVKGSIDLKQGKSGLSADLTVKNASELQGAQADIFAKMTEKSLEAIGYLNAKIPPSADNPKALSANLESVTRNDNSGGHFDLNLEVPASPADVPNGTGSAKLKADSKKLESSFKFELSGESIKGSDVPFTDLKVSISEKENKTTISFTVSAFTSAPLATQLKGLPQLASMLESQLKQMQVKFENLNFPAPAVEADKTIAKGEVTLVDIRTNIKPLLGMLAMQMQGAPDAQKAFEEMIEGKLDSFQLNLGVVENSLKGEIVLNASELDHFWNGYLTLLPALQAASNKDLAARMGEFGPIVDTLLDLNTKQAIASIKLLIESSMTLEGDASFEVAVQAADKATPQAADNATPQAGDNGGTGLATIKASGKIIATNYLDYVKKAKEAGLPVAENAVARLSLNLKDDNVIEGNGYLYSDGDLISHYKAMLLKAAQESKSSEDVQKAISDLQLNELAFKLNLKDNKVAIGARGDTSDLTKIVAIAQKEIAPKLQADLIGGALDVNWADQGDSKLEVNSYFANFLPGKDAAAIKEVMGLPANSKVSLDASASDVALVAVDAPEIAVDGKLAEVQTDGQKLLASSPLDIASGAASGSSGGNKTGLIALGALLLLGVGGFIAFGSKKS